MPKFIDLATICASAVAAAERLWLTSHNTLYANVPRWGEKQLYRTSKFVKFVPVLKKKGQIQLDESDSCLPKEEQLLSARTQVPPPST